MENAQLGARCEELARSEGRFRDRNGELEREGDGGGMGGQGRREQILTIAPVW